MIEGGGVYLRGDGAAVHVMGPAKREDVPGALWALDGNHYHPDGRMVSREASERHRLGERIGTHSDGGRGEGWAASECDCPGCVALAAELGALMRRSRGE